MSSRRTRTLRSPSTCSVMLSRVSSRATEASPLRLAEGDVLGAVPEHPSAQLTQVLVAGDDRGEVIPRECTRLARERDVAVREQELGLADATGVEDQLAGTRVARGVLRPDAHVEVAHRDPPALARPAHVDDLRVERQHLAEGRDGLGRRVILEAGREGEAACVDLEHGPTLTTRGYP